MKSNSSPPDNDLGFRPVAQQIVIRMRDQIVQIYSPEVAGAVDKIAAATILVIAQKVENAFLAGRANKTSLDRLAFKMLAIIAIKSLTKRYSLKSMGHVIGSDEYFERVYKKLFVELGLPINCIGAIDPNLHTCLRKDKKFPIVTQMLRTCS